MVIFSDDFETDDFSKWTDVHTDGSGEAITQSTTKHHGTFAAKFTIIGGGCFALVNKVFASSYTELYARAYVRISALPTSGKSIVAIELCGTGWADAILALEFAYSGAPKWGVYYLKNGSYSTKFSGSISVDTWYCVEIYVKVSATAGQIRVWIDGVEDTNLGDITFDNNDKGDIQNLVFGGDYWIGDSYAVVLIGDCVVVDSAPIGPEAAGVTVKKGSNLSATMTEMLNSKMLFSIADRFPKLVPRRF